jgi:hypothetical protein
MFGNTEKTSSEVILDTDCWCRSPLKKKGVFKKIHSGKLWTFKAPTILLLAIGGG